MIGITVSRYKILSVLGGGGMGVVYEAEDLELGRRVAVKFLPEERARNVDALERFKREARAASALNHPNICTIYDVGRHEGQPFLVMERLSGHTIKHQLAGGGLGLDEVIRLGAQIADALGSAHRAGIVHRDLKPANLFVTERGEAKILDFGLAKWTSGDSSEPITADAPTVADEFLTEEGKALGTVTYMSPEQARGTPLDTRSDIFSFGVVLYEMGTGRLPFEGGSAAEFFASILKSDPAPPSHWNPDLPARFDEIVLKALEKDPALRYQSVGDLRADLLRLERDSHSSHATAAGWAAAPAVHRPTAERSAQRPRRRLWIGVSATAAVVLAALALWRGRSDLAPGPPNLSVLVADTVNRTGDEMFDDVFAELLTTSLHQSRFLSLFPRTRAAYVLRRMQRDPEAVIDEALGLEICQRENLGGVVSASLSSLGEAFVILMRVLDSSGKELGNAREIFRDPTDMPARIDAAVRSLRAAVGESAASIRASSLPLAEVTSASLEAVRFYTLGQQHQRGGDLAQALVLFRKALDIDPTFAMAQDGIAVIYYNMQDRASAEEHLSKAVALASRVGEAERQKILADYNLVRRNFDVACGHLEVLIGLRPLDPIPVFNLGVCRGSQLDFDAAIAASERALRMQESPLGYANLARYLLAGGQAEAAWSAIEPLRVQNPTSLPLQFIAARAELALGRVADAQRTYETMSAYGGDLEVEGGLGLADLSLAGGRLEEARQHLDAAWRAAEQRNNVQAQGRAAAAAAELALATGDEAELETALDRLRGITHPEVLYLKIRTNARAGRSAEARAALEQLLAAVSDSGPDRAMVAMARAELALSAGRTDEATSEADLAWGLEHSVLARETQARAYAEAGDGSLAISAWEEVLARRTQRLDSYDSPGFHRIVDAEYRLATMLDDAGEDARAKPLFAELLEIWEDAGESLPAYVDVRRRLTGGR